MRNVCADHSDPPTKLEKKEADEFEVFPTGLAQLTIVPVDAQVQKLKRSDQTAGCRTV